jgi:hypothetical protein
MQTVALGFLPKTLDLDLVIWNIHRAREHNVFLMPKQGAFNPFIWRWFTIAQARKRGFVVEEGLIKIKM